MRLLPEVTINLSLGMLMGLPADRRQLELLRRTAYTLLQRPCPVPSLPTYKQSQQKTLPYQPPLPSRWCAEARRPSTAQPSHSRSSWELPAGIVKTKAPSFVAPA